MGEREINEQWARWLRGRMRSRGYPTPTELGRESGVDQSVISRWLNEGRTPKVDQLRKVAGPLQASMLDLLVAAGYVRRDEIALGVDESTDDEGEVLHLDDLIDEAKQHLLNQYNLLRRLSEVPDSKNVRPGTPARVRPLPAAARRGKPDKP